MEKVSVTIITLNEEANIGECLESLKWADEIIVSDSKSTDRTVEICRSYGARVYTDEWLGFGAQKNLCQSRAKNQWIFNIDADERAAPGFGEEVARVLAAGTAPGYYVARKNYFGDKWIRHCGWYPDLNLRLYRKDAGRFSERAVHEAVVIEGPTGRLSTPLIHRTYSGVSDYLKRMERYSSLAALEMKKEGRKAGGADLLLRPVFTFIKMFFLRKGFLEGRTGLTLSMLYSRYTYRKYTKLRELLREGGPAGKRRSE
ncbi:MAG: glycosyltransferase family 2 protein [Thermodesulfobacteriota bacterium]